MSFLGLLTLAAAAVAVLALVRVVWVGARFDDQPAQADRLSRALVAHGIAMLALAAVGPIAGAIPWYAAIFAGAWGATWLVVGRAYDPAQSPHDRSRRLEAASRDERRQPGGDRFVKRRRAGARATDKSARTR